MSCHPVSPLGALWPSCICTCVSGPGFILGVPSASRCSGVCGTRFSEDLTPEETQTSWDKDIPAINQGEGTVSSLGVWGMKLSVWRVKTVLNAQRAEKAGRR